MIIEKKKNQTFLGEVKKKLNWNVKKFHRL